MRTRHVLAVFLLALVVPGARGDVIGGRHEEEVKDDGMHVIPAFKGLSAFTLNFTFGYPGPDPTSADPTQHVTRAKVAFRVDHELPDKPGWFDQDISLHMTEHYFVQINNVVIKYRVDIDADHPGWRWKSLLQQFTRCRANEGHGGFCGAGTYTVDYEVYKDDLQVANGTVVEYLGGMIASERDLPGGLIWVIYENRNLTVAPDFLSDGALPRFNSALPVTTYGRVFVPDVDFHGLELRYTASQTVPSLKASYGFCRPGADCSYDWLSLGEEVAQAAKSILTGLARFITDWLIFSWIPGGPEFREVSHFALEVLGTYATVLLDDLFLTYRAALVVAVSYGLLLFIDPIFASIFLPLWWLLKGLYYTVYALVRLLIWLAVTAFTLVKKGIFPGS